MFMVNKNLIFIGIFIIAGILFLSAQLAEIEGISSADFSYSGEGVELINDELFCQIEKCTIQITKGDITTTIEATKGAKFDPVSGRISITESGAEFSINGNKFSNIDSGEIILDQTNGKITEAKFFTNNNGGTYDINENKFKIPGNKEFIYPSKKGGFLLPDGTEILEAQKNIRLETLENEFIKYKENELSGVLNFDENGNVFVNLNNKAIINGVAIENKGRLPSPNLLVFFDKSSAIASGKSEYVIVDSSKNFFAFKEAGGNLPRSIRIEFNKENYLFGDIMDEKDYLFIGEGGVNPGYLEITRSSGKIPVVKTLGDIEINPDEKRFLFQGENIIFKTGTNAWPIPEDRSMISGTVPMVFESQDRKVVGLIPNNDDKRFYWTSRGGEVAYGPVSGVAEEQLGVELPDEIIKSWAENSEVTQDRTNTISVLANDGEIKKDYKNYLAAENIFKKYNIKIEELNKELLVKQEQGKDSSISWTELEKKWGIKETNEIKTALKNRVKLIDNVYSQIKVEEDIPGIAKFNVEEEILKVMGLEEFKALNNCKARGGSFDNCFDENYKYFGLKTSKCITNPNYCERLTFYKFNKMRTQ